jgi:hypothetical protein
MHDETDIPLSDEEMALARKGEALIKAELANVQAPHSLRESIENDRARAARRAPLPFWRRYRVALIAGGGAAVVLVGVAVALQAGGGSSEPTLAGVDGVAGRSASGSVPKAIGGEPPVLDVSVGGVQFPDWRKKFGWTAIGRRDDEVAGRTVTTVFYRNPDGTRLGYAVVGGEPLAEQPPGRKVVRDGKTYHVAGASGRNVVTWTQQGQTCVIVAPATVPQSKLIELAASRNV